MTESTEQTAPGPQAPTMTPEWMAQMISGAVVAATQAAMQTQQGAKTDGQKVITPAEDPAFAARVKEMEMERKRTVIKAARNVGEILPNNFAMSPAMRAMVLAKLGMMDWTHHQKRNRYDMLGNMKAARIARGYGGDDREIEDLETQMNECQRDMEDIEILCTAAELQFDQAVSDHHAETGNDYTGQFRFDVSDEAFAQWLEKESSRRARTQQNAAAAARTGDDALRRCGISDRLGQLAAGSIEE